MELRTDEEIKKGLKKTAYHTMKPAMAFKLVELQRAKDIVAWYVCGLYNGEKEERAHFTVL